MIIRLNVNRYPADRNPYFGLWGYEATYRFGTFLFNSSITFWCILRKFDHNLQHYFSDFRHILQKNAPKKTWKRWTAAYASHARNYYQ